MELLVPRHRARQRAMSSYDEALRPPDADEQIAASNTHVSTPGRNAHEAHRPRTCERARLGLTAWRRRPRAHRRAGLGYAFALRAVSFFLLGGADRSWWARSRLSQRHRTTAPTARGYSAVSCTHSARAFGPAGPKRLEWLQSLPGTLGSTLVVETSGRELLGRAHCVFLARLRDTATAPGAARRRVLEGAHCQPSGGDGVSAAGGDISRRNRVRCADSPAIWELELPGVPNVRCGDRHRVSRGRVFISCRYLGRAGGSPAPGPPGDGRGDLTRAVCGPQRAAG